MARVVCVWLVVSLISVIKCNAAKPNIIIILADDLGWNDLSYHGSDQIPTPNIDALAYNGIILNNQYVMPTCTPSRAALMTGKYPIHLGMQGPPIWAAEPSGLPLREKLLPQYFKELGYATKMIGKWHLGYYRSPYIPIQRGFDSHFGYYNGFMGYYDHIIQDSYSGLGDFSGQDLRENNVIRWDKVGKYATDVFTEEAEKVISDHSADTPLFLYIAHLAVHAGNKGAPLEAPQETVLKFRHIADPNRRIYAAMVSKLDDSVGRVVKALSEKGILENSIIVFMSDNGAPTLDNTGSPTAFINWGSNYPFRGVKNTLWGGGVRSPTIIWSPTFQQKPRVSNQLMHITDWLPTLLSAADGNFSHSKANELDGIDQWRSLLHGEPSRRRYLLINIDEKERHAAIIRDSWKLTIGKFQNGSYDGFYGAQPRKPLSLYNTTEVITSAAYQALQQLSERFSLPITDEASMLNLRYQATIQCLRNSGPKEGSPCPEGPCLFNLEADPCETVNLATRYLSVSSQMYDVLKYYKSTLLPQINQPPDPNANPIRFNNTWQSWVL